MHQRKGDCIHAYWSVPPTDQVHLWLVILDKCTEIDQCPHIISKSETEGAVWYKILVKIVYS